MSIPSRSPSRRSSFAFRLLAVGLVIAALPATGLAQGLRVGGHIGLATPLVTVTDGDDTDISETFVLVAPLGVTLKVTERFAVDFETQVANQVDPRGRSSLVVAPGAIYNTGPVALGLRVASAIDAPANVGVIPLINRGMVPVGKGTWFVEAAFPFFVRSDPDPDWTFDVVLHTGVAF